MTLTEFLLARIADDERVAKIYPFDAYGDPWELWKDPLSPEMLIVSPVRALAECEAKRRIVDLARRVSADDARAGTLLTCLLALPYADHPDYRPEWKP